MTCASATGFDAELFIPHACRALIFQASEMGQGNPALLARIVPILDSKIPDFIR
jgi:hypothetical protein